MHNGERDVELERKLKKHQNFVNKKIKSFDREKAGQIITSESNVQEIWKSVNGILRLQKSLHKNLNIVTEDKLIEEPLQVAEKFNVFFKEKIEKLVEGIKNNNLDPLSKLKTKFQAKDLKFKLKTVSENKGLQILKQLKSKKSFGHDGISSQVLKIGAKILVIPLTYIINTSILTGKFPTNWKIAKVTPLYKKGDKKVLKNYRPVSLLSVSGMVLEKVVANQIEEFFEENNLFIWIQKE